MHIFDYLFPRGTPTEDPVWARTWCRLRIRINQEPEHSGWILLYYIYLQYRWYGRLPPFPHNFPKTTTPNPPAAANPKHAPLDPPRPPPRPPGGGLSNRLGLRLRLRPRPGVRGSRVRRGRGQGQGSPPRCAPQGPPAAPAPAAPAAAAAQEDRGLPGRHGHGGPGSAPLRLHLDGR